MRALHVVSVNLELRLGVDDGVLRKQEILVALLGVGLLGVLAHDDLAVEDSRRSAVEHAFVKLAAAAVGLGVVERRVIVDVLPAADDVEAVEGALGAFAAEHCLDLLTNERSAKLDRSRVDDGRSLLLELQGRDVKRLRAFLLDSGVFHLGVLARHHLRNSVGEVDAAEIGIRRGIDAEMDFDETRLRAVSDQDQVSWMRDGGAAVLGR